MIKWRKLSKSQWGLIMTYTKGTVSKGGADIRATGLKEWRPPSLRKLPIAATGSGVQEGNEGNTKKTSGTQGGFS
jgi:hypothetical protein